MHSSTAKPVEVKKKNKTVWQKFHSEGKDGGSYFLRMVLPQEVFLKVTV